MKKYIIMSLLIITLTLMACEQQQLINKDRCEIEPIAGPCEALIYKYYFDQETQTCEEFMWGGCEGVVPFETMEECQTSCETSNIESAPENGVEQENNQTEVEQENNQTIPDEEQTQTEIKLEINKELQRINYCETNNDCQIDCLTSKNMYACGELFLYNKQENLNKINELIQNLNNAEEGVTNCFRSYCDELNEKEFSCTQNKCTFTN
jgi:hypothetical protein